MNDCEDKLVIMFLKCGNIMFIWFKINGWCVMVDIIMNCLIENLYID